ncbi:MAG: tRNA (adenosine(37)-N6)-threonylcarbamoyltransferase complex dimerization subunit type 1 TsaB [Bdellovibrionota bacterium]
MVVLAFDTSQIQAAIALLKDGKCVQTKMGSVSVAHSEGFLPLLDDLLKAGELDLKSVDVFAIGVGPGSFTGVRIGCATVKALAQVLKKPILPFSSLRALALSSKRAINESASLVAMANAYQKQVFIGWEGQGVASSWTESVVEPAAWMRQHFSKTETLHQNNLMVFCGTGAGVYRAQLELEYEQLKQTRAMPPIEIEDSTLYCTGEGLRLVVNETVRSGGLEKSTKDYFNLHANYMRPSQAEIKLDSLLKERV